MARIFSNIVLFRYYLPCNSNGVLIKLTRRGPNEYVQLVEAFRDEAGRPKQRTVASLGRRDQVSTERRRNRRVSACVWVWPLVQAE